MASNFKSAVDLGIGNIDSFPACKNILPSNYEYVVCSYKDELSDDIPNQCQFIAIVRTRLLTKEEVKNWLDQFSKQSKSTFRVDRTHRPSCRTVFKVQYRCHHNTRPRKNSVPHAKHTRCNAKLTINVKNVKHPELSKDKFLPEFPTVIMLRYTHNHQLFKPESLRYCDPAPEIRNQFLQLFRRGHSVTSAYNLYKSDILEAHEISDYDRVINDRGILPNNRWIRYLFDKVFIKERCRPQVDTFESLTKIINSYNVRCGDQYAKMVGDDDKQFAAAICSPLMKRIHQNPSSSEYLLIDSSSRSNRFLCKVYVLLVSSQIGGFPVGILITSTGLKHGLMKALKLYIDLLPINSFGGKGATAGPSFIITNGSAEIKNAFSSIFSNSVQIPSIYHSLKSVWSFLHSAQHDIPTGLESQAYTLLNHFLQSSSPEELSKNYDDIVVHPIFKSCPLFQRLVVQLNEDQKESALFKLIENSIELIPRMINTSFEVFRDQILTRTKASDPVQLFEFIIQSFMEEFFLCRIECAVLKQEDEWFSNEYKEVSSVAAVQDLTLVDIDSINSIYEVINNASGDHYLVDARLGFCSCFVGRSGAKCFHQLSVKRDKDQPKFHFQELNGDPVAQRFFQKLLIDCGRLSDQFLVFNNGPNVLTSSTCQNPIGIADNPSTYLVLDSEESSSKIFSSVEKVKQNLKSVYEDMIFNLENNSEEFLPAVEHFISTYKSLNELEKVEALSNFSNSQNNIQNVVLLQYDPL